MNWQCRKVYNYEEWEREEMKMKSGKKLVFLTALLCLLFGLQVYVQAADMVTMPDRAVRSGNNIYWAIGNDGSGFINCYNIKTKKSKQIIKLNSKQLSVKGNYLYFTVDNYLGSDARDHYIYRAQKNGKNRKKLAKGNCPVVIGNYIYYIGTKKGKLYGVTVDMGTTGIYRMKLNGSGKKCIYKPAGTESIASLYQIDNKLLFKSDSSWYTITLAGKKKTGFTWSFGKQNCNTNMNYFASYGNSKWPVLENKVSANNKGYSFAGSGGSIIRTSKSGVSKTIKTLKNQRIYKIIDLNGYLFVIAHGEKMFNGYQTSCARVYVMKSSGKGQKKLTEFILAGGGW